MGMVGGGAVLVVEDDEGMREAISELLGAAGIESTAYGSAEAFLAGGDLDHVACVISDLKLPSMSGFELLSALRARGPRPPVIVITANDAPGVRQEAQRLGAAAYLTKPFDAGTLLSAIRSATAPSGPA
ncbi:MAG TPA: response regulator [Casimicrobiaceae bacterium]|nr:response regulator [Casimicrobiaceae bacterium]